MKRIYQVKYEPTGFALLSDDEGDFLDTLVLIVETPLLYTADEDMLKDAIEGYREEGKELPQRLIAFLQEQVGKNEGEFIFTLE